MQRNYLKTKVPVPAPESESHSRMRSVILVVACGLRLWGALPASNVWEIRPTNGSDSNGGCFDPSVTSPGTDYTKQNSVEYSFTDLVITSTTTIVSSASHNFASADVGNCIHISAGSGFTTGWYSIRSVASNNATLDRSAGTASSTGGTWLEGGALQSFGQVITILSTSNENAANQTVYVKAESIIATGAQIDVATSNASTFIGYTSTRGDNGQVTVKLNTLSPTGGDIFLLNSGGGNRVSNFIANGNYSGSSRAAASGFHVNGSNNFLVNVLVENVSESGITFSNGDNTCFECVVTNSGSGGNPAIVFSSNNGPNYCIFCVAYANQGTGFEGFGGVLSYCVSANNTGGTSDGFQIGGSDGPMLVDHATSYGNGHDGFNITPNSNIGQITNSIAYGNAAYGINAASAPPTGLYYLNFNAYGGNGTANLNNVSAGANDVTLSADPTVAGASNNFALSTGGIAALGGLGFPGVLAAGGTGYSDIGALQHQASGGTSGPHAYPIVQ